MNEPLAILPLRPVSAKPTSVLSQIEQTVIHLSDILRDKAKREALFKLRDSDAQSLIDGLNYFVSDPSFRGKAEPWLLKHTVIALRKLCEVSMLYPTCYVLEDIQDISSKAGGGFCDIHQGRYDNQLLCLKVVRLYQDSNIERLLKAHAREAILWSQLEHPNIVPFYGIFYWDRMERICLVSPWMKNGDIVEYLERVPNAPRKLFVYDIANGLQYLHDRNIVHGDLKGRNVLIDDYQNACLADFGLSTVVTDDTLGFPRTTFGPSGHTTRWASPELLEDDDVRLTCQSDLWAFGCVCYEVLTGFLPFAGCSDLKVVSKLMKKELPADLHNTRLDPNHNFSEKLCELVGRCWSIEATRRPPCQAILRVLEGVTTIQRPRGPRLESFTTRNSLIHSRAWLRTPALIKAKEAENLLEKLYSGKELASIPFHQHLQFSTRTNSQDRIPVLPDVPHAPDVSAVVDVPASLSRDGASYFTKPLWRKIFGSRDRIPHHNHDPAATDLTTMIVGLIATGCQDWSLLSDVCYRASLNESSAKEAIEALRREFKYGDPPGQLTAARLWATMLYNCSSVVVLQSKNRKFVDAVRDVMTNTRTAPVVRDRLLDVTATAAFFSQSKNDTFRALWRHVKPSDKPDEGLPLLDGDPMLNLPLPLQTSPSAISTPEPPRQNLPPSPQIPPLFPTRNPLISRKQIAKQLLQGCRIGQENATLLAQALCRVKPEMFEKDSAIQDIYDKCRASHELLLAQVPWATAEAEKSIIAKEENDDLVQGKTEGEQLLDAILTTREKIREVLNQYDDFGLVNLERRVEHLSTREARMERGLVLQPSLHVDHHSPSARTTSPQSQHHRTERVTGLLAPFPPAPFGPRPANARLPPPNHIFRSTNDFNLERPMRL